AWKRQHDPTNLAHDVHRRFRRTQARLLALGQDQEIAPADRLLDPEHFLHEKLALHHGDSPVAPTIQEFARLEAIAKMPQPPADVDPICTLRQSSEPAR